MYVGVIGTGEYQEPYYSYAYEAGRLIAEKGGIVVCGGLYGVMEAVCKGAKEAGGISVAILPGSARSEANPYASVVIPTGLGEMRNAIIVRASDAVLAIGGGFGTLSEIGFALKTGKKVVLLKSWQCKSITEDFEKRVIIAGSIEEAVEKIFEK
jgi:hypothetical protein